MTSHTGHAHPATAAARAACRRAEAMGTTVEALDQLRTQDNATDSRKAQIRARHEFDGIEYTRERAYAPCYGTHHDHSRRIGRCPSCAREVVLYKGRVINVQPVGKHRGRKFVCWSPNHRCFGTDPAAADTARTRYAEAKKAFDGLVESLKNIAPADINESVFNKLNDANHEFSTARATLHDLQIFDF